MLKEKRIKILRQADANIDATAWRIFHQHKGNREKIRNYLMERLEFNIPPDITRKNKNKDEVIIFSDPCLLANFFESLNGIGCNFILHKEY